MRDKSFLAHTFPQLRDMENIGDTRQSCGKCKSICHNPHSINNIKKPNVSRTKLPTLAKFDNPLSRWYLQKYMITNLKLKWFLLHVPTSSVGPVLPWVGLEPLRSSRPIEKPNLAKSKPSLQLHPNREAIDTSCNTMPQWKSISLLAKNRIDFTNILPKKTFEWKIINLTRK